jgi:putrescine transport system substrate-binding protein
MPANGWELVFNPVYTAKLKSCGIAYLDSRPKCCRPPCITWAKRLFQRRDRPQGGGRMLAKARPHIRLFLQYHD